MRHFHSSDCVLRAAETETMEVVLMQACGLVLARPSMAQAARVTTAEMAAGIRAAVRRQLC